MGNLLDSLTKRLRIVAFCIVCCILPLSAQQAEGSGRTEVEDTPLLLKTNLLYDALLSPSIEAEYRLNPRFSLHADFSVAWWSRKSRHKYYQLLQFSPEVRYRFRPDNEWRGHYIGAFIGAGYYDLENGDDGYKGEYGMAGVSYGYLFPIGRRLSLELGVGVGFLFTEYEEYLPIDGHYVYQQTSRTHYVGPLKAKVSLVWRIDQYKLDKLARWLKGGKS